MKRICYLLLLFSFIKCGSSKGIADQDRGANTKEYYTLQVYHLANNDQIALVDNFLKDAWLPALHRQGISKVGVFKPVTNDTATDKRIIVFTPFTSLQQFEKTTL